MGYVAIDDVKMQIVVIGEVNDVAAVTFSTVAIIKQQQQQKETAAIEGSIFGVVLHQIDATPRNLSIGCYSGEHPIHCSY